MSTFTHDTSSDKIAKASPMLNDKNNKKGGDEGVTTSEQQELSSSDLLGENDHPIDRRLLLPADETWKDLFQQPLHIAVNEVVYVQDRQNRQKWRRGVVKKVHPPRSTRLGYMYDVELVADGDVASLASEMNAVYVKQAIDYHPPSADWGDRISHYIDTASREDYLTSRGWFEIKGTTKRFLSLHQAMQAADDVYTAEHGSATKPSDLLLCDEWTLAPNQPPQRKKGESKSYNGAPASKASTSSVPSSHKGSKDNGLEQQNEAPLFSPQPKLRRKNTPPMLKLVPKSKRPLFLDRLAKLVVKCQTIRSGHAFKNTVVSKQDLRLYNTYPIMNERIVDWDRFVANQKSGTEKTLIPDEQMFNDYVAFRDSLLEIMDRVWAIPKYSEERELLWLMQENKDINDEGGKMLEHAKTVGSPALVAFLQDKNHMSTCREVLGEVRWNKLNEFRNAIANVLGSGLVAVVAESDSLDTLGAKTPRSESGENASRNHEWEHEVRSKVSESSNNADNQGPLDDSGAKDVDKASIEFADNDELSHDQKEEKGNKGRGVVLKRLTPSELVKFASQLAKVVVKINTIRSKQEKVQKHELDVYSCSKLDSRVKNWEKLSCPPSQLQRTLVPNDYIFQDYVAFLQKLNRIMDGVSAFPESPEEREFLWLLQEFQHLTQNEAQLLEQMKAVGSSELVEFLEARADLASCQGVFGDSRWHLYSDFRNAISRVLESHLEKGEAEYQQPDHDSADISPAGKQDKSLGEKDCSQNKQEALGAAAAPKKKETTSSMEHLLLNLPNAQMIDFCDAFAKTVVKHSILELRSRDKGIDWPDLKIHGQHNSTLNSRITDWKKLINYNGRSESLLVTPRFFRDYQLFKESLYNLINGITIPAKSTPEERELMWLMQESQQLGTRELFEHVKNVSSPKLSLCVQERIRLNPDCSSCEDFLGESRFKGFADFRDAIAKVLLRRFVPSNQCATNSQYVDNHEGAASKELISSTQSARTKNAETRTSRVSSHSTGKLTSDGVGHIVDSSKKTINRETASPEKDGSNSLPNHTTNVVKATTTMAKSSGSKTRSPMKIQTLPKFDHDSPRRRKRLLDRDNTSNEPDTKKLKEAGVLQRVPPPEPSLHPNITPSKRDPARDDTNESAKLHLQRDQGERILVQKYFDVIEINLRRTMESFDSIDIAFQHDWKDADPLVGHDIVWQRFRDNQHHRWKHFRSVVHSLLEALTKDFEQLMTADTAEYIFNVTRSFVKWRQQRTMDVMEHMISKATEFFGKDAASQVSECEGFFQFQKARWASFKDNEMALSARHAKDMKHLCGGSIFLLEKQDAYDSEETNQVTGLTKLAMKFKDIIERRNLALQDRWESFSRRRRTDWTAYVIENKDPDKWETFLKNQKHHLDDFSFVIGSILSSKKMSTAQHDTSMARRLYFQLCKERAEDLMKRLVHDATGFLAKKPKVLLKKWRLFLQGQDDRWFHFTCAEKVLLHKHLVEEDRTGTA